MLFLYTLLWIEPVKCRLFSYIPVDSIGGFLGENPRPNWPFLAKFAMCVVRSL